MELIIIISSLLWILVLFFYISYRNAIKNIQDIIHRQGMINAEVLKSISKILDNIGSLSNRIYKEK